MKSKLTLHEAMAVVLLTQPGRVASTTVLSQEIERRDLYRKKDRQFAKPSQIRLRATLSGGKYLHLFEWIGPDLVKLRNLVEGV